MSKNKPTMSKMSKDNIQNKEPTLEDLLDYLVQWDDPTDYPVNEFNAVLELINSHIEAKVNEAKIEKHFNFTKHTKHDRVHAIDDEHLSITNSGISFGKKKPPYERVVIEYDKGTTAIRFHEPLDNEYGISYKIGKNPATSVYGFRARPFKGILPTGYYRKVGRHTYQRMSKLEGKLKSKEGENNE